MQDDFIDLDQEEREAEEADALSRSTQNAAPRQESETKPLPRNKEDSLHSKERRFWAPSKHLAVAGTPMQAGDSEEETTEMPPSAVSEDAEEAYLERISTLEAELRGVKKDLEARDAKLREIVQAHQEFKEDTDKFLARTERNIESRVESAKQDFLKEFLELVDNFDLALKAFEKDQDPVSLSDGMRMMYKQAEALLRGFEVERFSPDGEPFDPALSEAVEVVPVEDDKQHNLVLETLRPGYLFKGALLRPARVRVGKKQD